VAADRASQRLFFIDARQMTLLGELKLGSRPGPMGILPDGSKVYFADAGERKISAVDLPHRTLLAHLETSSPASTLVFKPDGGEIFALSGEASTLTVVDAFHDEIEQSPLTTGPNPIAAVLLYIATAADGNVLALDAPDRQPLAFVHVGISPSAVALTPDERYLLVADSGSSCLAIVRTDRNTLVTTIPVGQDPVSVVVPPWQRK
jgi:YVTN family beta-propeller protein